MCNVNHTVKICNSYSSQNGHLGDENIRHFTKTCLGDVVRILECNQNKAFKRTGNVKKEVKLP
jgi:hypothetical protein